MAVARPKSMLARNVCSGTRPSRYHSLRAISAPPSRPPQVTLMPWAPSRMADCTARFMARRKVTRFSSCWAMFSATSLASSSGFLTSTMLRVTSPEQRCASSRRSVSISCPFLPITTPGRAVWIVTRAFLAGRSTITRLTPAWASRFSRKARILRSSARSLA